jgi:hypothetical protein
MFIFGQIVFLGWSSLFFQPPIASSKEEAEPSSLIGKCRQHPSDSASTT